jgi:predicted MFS family arabinose efflux permease
LLPNLGAFLGPGFGLSATAIGLVYALVGGAFAVASVAAGKRLGGMSPRVAIAAASLATAALIVPLLRVPNLALVLVLLPILAVAGAVWGVAVIMLLAAESPAGAGATMVLNGSLLNLGTAAGAVLGGILIAVAGYGALGIGFPGIALAATVLAWWPARA